jgi:hypothetical protein
MDKSDQMTLYVENIDGQKKLTANVWNWDPEWKIEYYLDGQAKGLLKNERGLDPLAVKLYTGAQLPDPRPFVEPKETGHLFTASFGSEVAKVRVVATDRFGRKYEEEVSA